MRDAFIRQLAGLAKDDARIVLLTGDLGFGVFDEYRRILPEQFINVGVAEQILPRSLPAWPWKATSPSPTRSRTSRRCAVSSNSQ